MVRRSEAGSIAWARRAVESFPAKPRKRSQVSIGVAPRSATARASVQLHSVESSTLVNAYWARDEVVFVHRTPEGVSLKRVLAEHSCFVKAADVPPDLPDRLRRHETVMDVRAEGEWLRIMFMQRDDCARFCNAMHNDGVQTYEGALHPVLRAMVDRGFVPARPSLVWTDIETDSRVPFSRKEDARILCWATVGKDGRERTACLAEDSDAAERDLLAEWWDAVDDYDQIAAWNGERFDFPVIQARTELHGLRVEPRRFLWLDHLEWFRRANMSASGSGDEKQSMKLDDVARGVLGTGKLDFDASKTWQEWEAGGGRRKRLVDYCAQDTRLMPAIEAKTGYIELLLTLGEACGTFADDRGANPTTQVDGFLQRLAHERGYKFPTKRETVHTGGKFKGAYVMEPRTIGIETAVHVCDFERLYPSVIRTWNMSPETLVPDPNGQPGSQLEGCSLSPLTGMWFRQQPEGMLGAAVAEMLRLRMEWEAKRKACPPGTDEWKEADRRVAAYKIAANSFYGVIGAPTYRLFDRNVAESVTQCGVLLIKQTIEAAEARGMRVVYGDTDSAFITGVTADQFREFVQWCNDELYPEIVRELGCERNFIRLAYEKEFRRLVMTTAKKYGGSYEHYKGKAADDTSKPEIKGLEYKRGDSLSYARKLQSDVINRLMGYKCEPSDDPYVYEAILREHYNELMTGVIALGDVLMSKRLNQPLDGYARKKLKDDSGWARQLPHIELARELRERGFDMGEGAKVDYVIVSPEAKPQRIVASIDWDGEIDRGATWRALVAPPTIRLLVAAFPRHVWTQWETMGKQPSTRKRAAK